MNTHQVAASTPAITTSSRTFARDVAVSVDIAASPTRVWALLTDGAAVPSWNSTVSKLAGTIAAGERLAIEVPAAPGRTFRPRVVELEADRRMVWADGFAPMFKGVRTFELEPLADGGTRFTMRERLGGVMLPMIKRALPDFAPVFATYAADLRRAAEAAQA